MSRTSTVTRKTHQFMLVVLAAAVLSAGIAAGPSQAKEQDGTKQAPAVSGGTVGEQMGTVEESFTKDFPNVKVTRVLESGVQGLYEVIMGTNIVYYAPAAHVVIAGDMFEAGGLNVTAEKRGILRTLHEAEIAKLIDTLPLDKAIKIGSGKNVVVEFTDIDCPYCRKVEEFFKDRKDITRYVFLLPLDQIHPQSAAKSREVLCAKNPGPAYTAAMAGGLDKAALKGCSSRDKDIEDVLSRHKAAANAMEVEGTPVMWVNKRQVTGADTKKIEEFISSTGTSTATVSGS